MYSYKTNVKFYVKCNQNIVVVLSLIVSLQRRKYENIRDLT